MYTADENRYKTMEYRRCGKSGLKLPAVSLGLWHNFGSISPLQNMRDMCHTAFDLGITHFDLANNYGPEPGAAEENFGRILRESLGRYRDELVISTKAGYGMWPGPYGDGGSRKYILASLDQSLKRMGLAYVDIFYHHRPDGETPMEESMLALHQAVQSGKALYAGISNYNKLQTQQAVAILTELKTPFIINQRRYSMLDRAVETEGLKDYAAEAGLGIIAFSPLAQGLLTGKYTNGIPQDSRVKTYNQFLNESHLAPEKLQRIAALNAIAAGRGQSLTQMALAWVLRDNHTTSVLIGASKPEQIAENAAAALNTAFTAEELAQIDKITLG